MWPFRRKQKNLDSVPTEVQEYYQAEQRERMGVAWLLAFVTLVLTVAVVLGLFFGGRTVYRKVAHKDKTVATVQPQKDTSPTTPKPTSGSSAKPETSSNDKKAGSTKSDNKSSEDKSTVSTNTPSATTPTQPDSSKSSPTPSTSPAQPISNSSSPKTTITNTGPTGTLAAFIGASALGFLVYELRLRRKFN